MISPDRKIIYSTWMSIALLTLFFGILFAATGDTVQEILPEDALEGIYENPEFLPLIDVQQAKVTLQDLATSLQQMQSDYSHVDTKRVFLEEQFGDMMTSIETTLDASEKNRQMISETLTKVTLLEANIAQLKENLKLLKHDLAISTDYVRDYILFLYQSYQQLYGTDESLSLFRQLTDLRGTDVSINAQHFARMLTDALQRQLLTIKKQQHEYLLTTRQLNTAKMWYYQAAKSLKQDLERLIQQKQYLYAQLRALQLDKETLDKRASQLSSSQEDLTSQVYKLKKLTLEDNSVASTAVASLLALPDRSVGKNYFTRPVLPIDDVGAIYGDVMFIAGKKLPNTFDRLRLEVAQGSLVHAAAPGLVYKVINRDDGGQNRVMILHKKGLVTLYTPLENIYVQEGDVVGRGKVIGTSGGQPWTRGAGLVSEWSRLDFSVYLNGVLQDPYAYLDISIFEQSSLPQKRQKKYFEDLYARDVPLQDLPKVSGTTLAQRRDSFLARYAVGPYADAALRYDAAQGKGIDPIFGICIWFSETSFRNFKSVNNIGNVGNDDQGNTVPYESPLAGAKALFNVLNNQYLGAYNTLNELSRFGNTDSFIYASSPYNRQKNVMKCLSAIYDYKVPEDYPFRITKSD